MTQIARIDPPLAAFAEVMTHDVTGESLGYIVRGGRPGPTLAVLGHGPEAERAYARLLAVETLAWMRGTIALFLVADTTDTCSIADQAEALGPIDRMMILPEPAQSSDAMWPHLPILRMCASLGMISGRGLPPLHPGLRVIYG